MIKIPTRISASLLTPTVKQTAVYPKLIVFDFHGTVSLDTTGDKTINQLKNRIKKYNNNEFKAPLSVDNWYTLMVRTIENDGLNTEDMVPRLQDLITFIHSINEYTNNKTKFAIASNLEQDSFIMAMMNLVFSLKGVSNLNPFNENTVVGTQGLNKYGKMPGEGKIQHISVILKNLGLELGKDIVYNDIVLIDNSDTDIAKVVRSGVKPVKVKEYFTIREWNDQYN